MDGFAIPLVMVILDALNTLLFLCGGIALAAYLGVHSCGNDVSIWLRRSISRSRWILIDEQKYVLTNGITNGSLNRRKRCREAQAVTAFLWFGFAAWVGSLILSALSSRGGASLRGGIRRGASLLLACHHFARPSLFCICLHLGAAPTKTIRSGESVINVLPIRMRSPVLEALHVSMHLINQYYPMTLLQNNYYSQAFTMPR